LKNFTANLLHVKSSDAGARVIKKFNPDKAVDLDTFFVETLEQKKLSLGMETKL